MEKSVQKPDDDNTYVDEITPWLDGWGGGGHDVVDDTSWHNRWSYMCECSAAFFARRRPRQNVT